MKLTALNKAEALRYLGYGSHEPDERIRSLLDECEKKAAGMHIPRLYLQGV